jgi:chemotaxis protein methyltransferase CheR
MTAGTDAVPTGRDKTREFSFNDEDFNSLRALVREVTGITLADSKRELVYGRLSRRLRVLGLPSFRDYRDLLASDEGRPELSEFTNAVTTNLTSFFRESHHFDYLRDQILKPRMADATGSRRIRIWSAGCSTGEEPYSTAITIAETIPDWQRWDIKILATDLDSEVLSRAQNRIYKEDRVKGMNSKRVATYFRESVVGGGKQYTVNADIASMISFRQLNLMNPLPMKGPLDIIFCRNVVIYFDKDTQRELFARMARTQAAGATLFLGHSESLFKVSEAWTLIGKTIYRRTSTL